MKSKINKVIATATLGVLAISPAMAYNETTKDLKENRNINIDIENPTLSYPSKQPSSELCLDYNISDITEINNALNYNKKDYSSDVEETSQPTTTPQPTKTPTQRPTKESIETKTLAKTSKPTSSPTVKPTKGPTPKPTVKATKKPVKTAKPTVKPTIKPTQKPVKTVSPTKKATKNKSRISYTEKDLDWLAKISWAENRDDGMYCMRLVAEVIYNRVLSKNYPNTITQVIFQKGQYQPTWGKTNSIYDQKPPQNVYDMCRDLLENGKKYLPDNVVYGAEFKQGKGVYEKIGRTYFCYE